MKAVSGKEFCRALEKHGWALLRIKGSHHIYGKPEASARLSLPVHKNDAIKIGLLRHLMKIAELVESDL